jgi:predicted transcriptional regulator
VRQPRNWFTSVQDNTIRKMKKLGYTPAEIGEKLGRTEYVVRERARTLNITWHKEVGKSILATTAPTGFDRDREAEAKHRDADRRFIIALAEAFQRGDHLPKPAPVRRPVPAKRHTLFSVWEDDNA